MRTFQLVVLPLWPCGRGLFSTTSVPTDESSRRGGGMPGRGAAGRALSATPGSDIPSVRTVLQNLCIAHIELRNEESTDILPYTHKRIVDKIVVPMDQDINSIKQKFLGVLEIYTKKLAMVKAIRKGHNPTTYKRYTLILARDEWRQNPPANIQNHVKGLTEVKP